MDFCARTGSLRQRRTGCTVAGVYEGRKLSPPARDLDGTLGTTILLHDVANVAAERALLVGLGVEEGFAESSYRKALSSTIAALRTTGAAEATICLGELPVNGRDTAWKIEQAVLAVMEGTYRFDQLKSKPPEDAGRALKAVVFHLAN